MSNRSLSLRRVAGSARARRRASWHAPTTRPTSKRSSISALLLSVLISALWLGGVIAGLTGVAPDPAVVAYLPDVVVTGKRASVADPPLPTPLQTAGLPSDAAGSSTSY